MGGFTAPVGGINIANTSGVVTSVTNQSNEKTATHLENHISHLAALRSDINYLAQRLESLRLRLLGEEPQQEKVTGPETAPGASVIINLHFLQNSISDLVVAAHAIVSKLEKAI